jgi:hypothetical protein
MKTAGLVNLQFFQQLDFKYKLLIINNVSEIYELCIDDVFNELFLDSSSPIMDYLEDANFKVRSIISKQLKSYYLKLQQGAKNGKHK